MPSTYTNIKLHLVFSTKYRKPQITPELQPRLYDYMGGIIRGEKGVLHEIGGIDDHIHLLVGWRADETISSLMRKLKGNSSRWVHETFGQSHPRSRFFSWQTGYAAFSVSQRGVMDVKRYIQRQPEHHGKEDFKLELIRLLNEHEIEYHERYVFE